MVPPMSPATIIPGAKNSYAEMAMAQHVQTTPTVPRPKDRSAPPLSGNHRLDGSKHSAQTSTGGESSTSEMGHEREPQRQKAKKRKVPSQKAMLSKALAKANQAVLLDNAQNFEGAMDAYRDACDLLRQVMSRSAGDDDRKKLEGIVSPHARFCCLKHANLIRSGIPTKIA
jgi:hypothetical protein